MDTTAADPVTWPTMLIRYLVAARHAEHGRHPSHIPSPLSLKSKQPVRSGAELTRDSVVGPRVEDGDHPGRALPSLHV